MDEFTASRFPWEPPLVPTRADTVYLLVKSATAQAVSVLSSSILLHQGSQLTSTTNFEIRILDDSEQLTNISESFFSTNAVA